MNQRPNSPIVIWISLILWLISVLAILWSLILFFYVGDILFFTGTDLVNAVVLLTAIIMLPPNFYQLHAIAHGNKIELHKANVFCCRLWTCIAWVIILNIVGIIVCIQRFFSCQEVTSSYLTNSIRQYRTVPKHRQFIDKLQWSLGCCGLKSYKDWFSQDWHDKIRDYEWISTNERNTNSIKSVETDSVPFSCCKSGSCVSSYLKELGNHSINTRGCCNIVHNCIIVSIIIHLVMFITVILLEILLLKHIMHKEDEVSGFKKFTNKFNIRHIMSVNDNFEVSSDSYILNEEDSEIDSSNAYCDEK
ncbi:RDS/peripherin-like protein xRDS35 [Vanessa atalanta]|uniref:RDS/peripherin-like protein xRDS35 n=1 Tax=Vanessa atalanta TaxID=42275 RepID=UPI001FCD791F|nr:RDS/peripherin-like protein xRDS35 [Vanessa atalanta]